MRETNLKALVDNNGIKYLKTDDGFVVKFRGSIFVYKGSVATVADLANVENPEVGDVYNVEDTDEEYYYTDSSTWEPFGVIVDISGKLDKVTSTSGYPRAYVVNAAGKQITLNLSQGPTPSTIPIRKADGTISVADPTEEASATTKKYVDGKVEAQTGTTDPTTSTVGYLGQFYFNTTNNALFQCTGVSGSTYTWTKQESAGGPSWHAASTSTISLNAATYHMVVCFYRGNGSMDNYDTSTIVIGPDLAYSLQCRGTTDGQGQYVTASNADIDTYDLTISAPSGCTFVGYFIS